MNYFTMHPNVYSSQHPTGLIQLLEESWVKNINIGEGTFYIVSGFANYNGGVRFYDVFKKHINAGGEVQVILGGSTSQRLSSKQVVKELLDCGANVNIINRKRLVHSKLYGYKKENDQRLIVTSGNFTGPGMSQNVESSVYLDNSTLEGMHFSWTELTDNISAQNWQIHRATEEEANPVWNLLYDENVGQTTLDETDKTTLLQTLSRNDTSRVTGRVTKGSQYFFLSKSLFDFFPPLTIKNSRGVKATYSCKIDINFLDIGITSKQLVTYEAENNFDFRLGTGKLRNTNIADEGDMFALKRISDYRYELKIYKKGTDTFNNLLPHCINYIGNRNKVFGIIPNDTYQSITGS